MKKFFKNIMIANGALLFLFFFTFAFCLQLINTDFVNNDKVWYEYLAKKEEQKYNEYDSYIADFEDDLKEIDLPEEDDAYGWDFFLLDSVKILAPFLLVGIGLGALIFTGFQFVESLKHIKFTSIFKSSLLAYCIFYSKDLFCAVYFLAFKSNYDYQDIQNVNKKISFSISNLIEAEDKTSWIFDILSDLNLFLLAYILLIPFFLKMATDTPYRQLAKNIIVPFLCGLVLYESLMTYLTL